MNEIERAEAYVDAVLSCHEVKKNCALTPAGRAEAVMKLAKLLMEEAAYHQQMQPQQPQMMPQQVPYIPQQGGQRPMMCPQPLPNPLQQGAVKQVIGDDGQLTPFVAESQPGFVPPVLSNTPPVLPKDSAVDAQGNPIPRMPE